MGTQGKTALVLSGGGARGAFEAGVIVACSKNQRFDIVCGTSIGSINAALTAQHQFDELENLWKTIAEQNIIRYIDVVQKALALVDDIEGLKGKPEAAFMNFHLLNDWFKIGSKKALFSLRNIVDSDPIKSLLTPRLSINALNATLIVSATNITNGTPDAFYSFVNASNDDVKAFISSRGADPAYELKQENYVDVIRASAAIPGAFAPVSMNLAQVGVNHDYVDGGVANNTPISLAIAAGATQVFVVFLDPLSSSPVIQPTSNLFEIGLASLTVMQQKILETDMKLARAQQPAVSITEVRPTKPIEVSVLGFTDAAGMDSAYQDGIVVGNALSPTKIQ